MYPAKFRKIYRKTLVLESLFNKVVQHLFKKHLRTTASVLESFLSVDETFSASLITLLGNTRNYMPPILVPSSAKRIATQILVIAKLNGRKEFTLRIFVCDIIHRSKELPVQVSNLSTRIRCESCSI